MKQAQEFYRVSCDSAGCGAVLHESGWEAEWWDAESIEGILEEESWATVGEQHFCCAHWTYDDNGEVVRITS
jgi:hypothetical protein